MKILKDKDILNVARKKAKHRNVKINRANEAGFAIIAVLTILAVCVALVVAMLTMTGNDRQSSAAYINKTRLDMALETALNDATITLEQSTDNDHFITLRVPDSYNFQGGQGLDGDNKDGYFYYNAKFEVINGTPGWNYYPLFSTNNPGFNLPTGGGAAIQGGSFKENGDRNTTGREGLSNANFAYTSADAVNNGVTFADEVMETFAWQSKQRPQWRELDMKSLNAPNRTQGSFAANMSHDDEYTIRYRYWIEDLQGYLPVNKVGNIGLSGNGSHDRIQYGAWEYDDDDDEDTSIANNRYFSIPGMNVVDPVNPKVLLEPHDEKISPMSMVSIYTLFENYNTANEVKTDKSDIDNQDKSQVDDEIVGSKGTLFSLGVAKQIARNSGSAKFDEENRNKAGGLQKGRFGTLSRNERMIEENFVADFESYWERPVLPPGRMVVGYANYPNNPTEVFASLFYDANDFDVKDQLIEIEKLNINSRLKDIEDEVLPEEKAVDAIANHIEKHIPNFDNDRKGDFPEDYLKTLAASIIDYADTDNEPTTNADASNISYDKQGYVEPNSNGYRGIDSAPFLNEYRMLIKRINTLGTTAQFEITPWIELWNPSDQMVSGYVSYKYENHYIVESEDDVNLTMKYDFKRIGQNISSSNDPTVGSTNDIERTTGFSGDIHNDPNDKVTYRWFPPQSVTLLPNQYKIVKFPISTYTFEFGTDGMDDNTLVVTQGSHPERNVNLYGPSSNFMLRWSEDNVGLADMKLLDRSLRGSRWIQDISYGLQSEGQGSNYMFIMGNNAGSNYGTLEGYGYENGYGINPGDPRISYYINEFMQNSHSGKTATMGGRNYAARKQYSSNPNIKEFEKRVYKLINPKLWPDGGASAEDSSDRPHVRLGRVGSRGYVTTDYGPADNGDFITPSHSKVQSTPTVSNPENFYFYAPTKISNRGYYFSMSELGHIFDPVMWESPLARDIALYNNSSQYAYQYSIYQDDSNTGDNYSGGIDENFQANGDALRKARHGGGNSLRIGRPDHKRFQDDGVPASRLLDIFSAGKFEPEATDDGLVLINGKININTASRQVLRAVLAGALVQDQSYLFASEHKSETTVLPINKNAYDGKFEEAGYIADAIIDARPISSMSQLAQILGTDGEYAFAPKINEDYPKKAEAEDKYYNGKLAYIDFKDVPSWTDAAAEEAFARLYNASTIRSRNYRVFVEAQVVKNSRSGNTNILAKETKAFTIFAKPQRDATGKVVSFEYKKELTN